MGREDRDQDLGWAEAEEPAGAEGRGLAGGLADQACGKAAGDRAGLEVEAEPVPVVAEQGRVAQAEVVELVAEQGRVAQAEVVVLAK
jgi:hypothetical protein